MIDRRQALAALLGAIGVACTAKRPPAAAPAPEPALDLDPLVDLVPAAGLLWLVDARPQQIRADRSLADVLGAVAPPETLDAFAVRHGVDIRRADQVAVSGHGQATLGLARLAVDPGRVEAAFSARAREVEGRAVERGVTRFWGTVGDEREQVAVLGHDGVAAEFGGLGPLRAAVAFAQGRLKRSLPALRADPLAATDTLLGAAPLRAFAPGPFGPDWSKGLGGLLGGATAAAARLCAADRGADRHVLELRLVLTGAWGEDAAAAADRLAASFRVLADDPLGRLTGLDRPVEGPTATGSPDVLALDVALDPVTMSRGLRAAVGAPLAEIMAF
jgi:hypothetical protein